MNERDEEIVSGADMVFYGYFALSLYFCFCATGFLRDFCFWFSALLAVRVLFCYFDFYASCSCSTIGCFDFCTIGS